MRPHRGMTCPLPHVTMPRGMPSHNSRRVVGQMNEPEIRSSDNVAQPQAPLALPAPDAFAADIAEPDSIFDRALIWIEQQPLPAAWAIFAILTLVHLAVLNIAGVANGVFIGEQLFLGAGSTAIEVLLLGFIAYNIVLPTLIGTQCVRTYDDLRPALAADGAEFAQTRAGLVDAFLVWRFGFGCFWAIILATVYGDLLRRAIPGEGWSVAVQTIWMYVRLALTFGLMGSSITYVALLHHRFRAATSTQLYVDLFDLTPIEPVARYARHVALFLVVLIALAGPSVSQPDAMYASAALLVLGVVLTVGAVIGAMWGARRAIRAAKAAATHDLQIYARELWRRAYAGGQLTEAVGIPALSAMLTVKNEIARVPDWPGGFAVFARIATLVIIPILSWFGGQLVAQLSAALTP